MINKERKIWQWLVVSSQYPSKISLTTKSIWIAVIPFLMTFWPHINFNGITDSVYAVVFYFLTAVASIGAVVGALRKIWLTLFGSKTGEIDS